MRITFIRPRRNGGAGHQTISSGARPACLNRSMIAGSLRDPLPGHRRDRQHLAPTRDQSALTLLGAGHIHLGHDDELRPLGQGRAVLISSLRIVR